MRPIRYEVVRVTFHGNDGHVWSRHRYRWIAEFARAWHSIGLKEARIREIKSPQMPNRIVIYLPERIKEENVEEINFNFKTGAFTLRMAPISDQVEIILERPPERVGDDVPQLAGSEVRGEGGPQSVDHHPV